MDNINTIMVSILLFFLICLIVYTLAFFIIMPGGYGEYKFIVLPLSIILSLAIYILRQNPMEVKKIQDTYLNNNQKSQLVISIVFSQYIKNKYFHLVVAIIIAMLLISYLFITLKLFEILIYTDSILLFYCFCLIGRNYLISLRVSKGLFGTNASEAKELLKFIISNSKDINFKDQDGGIKEIFFEEDLKNISPSTNKNLGEIYT